MSTRTKILIALLVALAVCVILIAPSVDLPATSLESLTYAVAFFLLMRLPLCSHVTWAGREVVSHAGNASPPFAPASADVPVTSLRC